MNRLMPLIKFFALLLTIYCLNQPLAAQYNADHYFTYLDNTFNEHDKSLQNLLIQELGQFLMLFPEDPNAGRVQYMLASVYNEKGKNAEAMAAYLKMLYLYPESGVIAANKDDLRAIINNKRVFREQKEWLLGLVDQDHRGLSTSDAYIAYLKNLMKADIKSLRDVIVSNCREFFRRFTSDPRNDQVVLWMAEAFLKSNDHREANTIFAKFSVLFPNSPQLANVLYKQGDIHYRNLRNPEKAIELLSRVVTDFPDSASAGDALFTIAEIKSEKQKDFAGAIADYQLLVEQYPRNERAAEALWERAGLMERRLEDYPGAVLAYNDLVEKYPSDRKGIEALEKMASIYEKRLEEYPAAAESLARIAELFPDYERAQQRIIDAGEIMVDRLKDYAKAIEYFQIVVDNYPGTDKAKSAAKKIEKAQEKLNEE